jgi:beta-1,2-mannobiose phosphorylase / 1,2-beta-oligomannan phosphorylase
LYRHPEPVLLPGPEPYDSLGVEDPRVHRFGDQFVMIYCGVKPDPDSGWRASLCMAVSTDLVRWQKRGVMPGDLDRNNNKDGVLFPTPIGGKFQLLHRPFGAGWPPQEIAIRLAQGESLDGPWQDLGVLLRAYPNPAVRTSWVGAGSVPISLGDGRYLHIFHTGNTLSAEERLYTLDAALLDMNRFDPEQPGMVVASRLQPLMVPETPAELRSESSLQVSNVLFACGSFLYQGWVTIVYGGADTYTLAARVRLDRLLRALEATGDVNPYQR